MPPRSDQQIYRVAWQRITAVVLWSGACVLAAVVIVSAPWVCAVAGASVWAGWRVWCADLGGSRVRAWRREVAEFRATPEARALSLLPAFLAAVLGWDLVLGGVGAAIVLVDVLAGLPVLLMGNGASRDVPELVPDAAGEPSHGSWADELEPLGPDDGGGSTTALCGPWALLPALTGAELWHAWEASGRALPLSPTPAARLRIVAARARYLDALAHRDPEGVALRLGIDAADLDAAPFGGDDTGSRA